jgi:hypothetical protein
MHFSLIQYHYPNPNPRIYDFGIILFRDDWTFTSKVIPGILDFTRVPYSKDQLTTSANAIVSRLEADTPKSSGDIEVFRSNNVGDIQISPPRQLDEELILNRLADFFIY